MWLPNGSHLCASLGSMLIEFVTFWTYRMTQRPRFDRETKILIGVWVAFMIAIGLSIFCQVLVWVIVVVASITYSA